MPLLLYPRERPGAHCIGVWVGLRAGWTGVKTLALTGIQFPDRSAHSELPYQLRYLGPHPTNPYA